jgi:hypothetical protein
MDTSSSVVVPKDRAEEARQLRAMLLKTLFEKLKK